MNELVKCLECGSEMEKGYVKMNEGIRWRTSIHHGGVLLRMGSVFWPHDYAAFLCRKCHWVLISYL